MPICTWKRTKPTTQFCCGAIPIYLWWLQQSHANEKSGLLDFHTTSTPGSESYGCQLACLQKFYSHHLHSAPPTFFSLPDTALRASLVPILPTSFWGRRHHTNIFPAFPPTNTGSITQFCKATSRSRLMLQLDGLHPELLDAAQVMCFSNSAA